MSKSLFEHTAVSWDAILNNDKNGTGTYSRSWHVHILWKRYERWSSYISHGYSKTSNRYLKSYDPKQESKQIIYLDTNNLHGYAMSKLQVDSNG